MHKAIFAILLVVLSVSSAFADSVPILKKYTQKIDFSDDLHFEHMLGAIVRQEKSFKKLNLNELMIFGNRTIKRSHLQKSLLVFKKHVVNALNCFQLYTAGVCYKEFSKQINQSFEFYKPVPEKWEKGYAEQKTLFTAYYSPDFEGSFTQTAVFKNPIYAKPKSITLQKSTSDQINYQNKLKNKNLAIMYVKQSLYDIWLLHVEGGGRVKIKGKDGKSYYMYLSYAGSNSGKFQMLYKYMIEQGMIIKGEATIAKQREYFVNHPQEQRQILASCPSFIYFSLSTKEPVGVKSISLTENRSLATDYRRLKEYGIINFVRAEKPIFENDSVSKIPFSRFFINQDTGGAIKGNARSDLYFGYGDQAELAANHVYGLGEQYFLILK
ncbi:MAG: hypothetical protein HON90_17040 [Halobacteriovoraceae bacterium]|nr:hypothetical protein [Halobacteriovoraceae bacterium]